MMVYIVVSWVGLATVPILASLAWNGWARRLRGELPAWRNGLCLSALLLLSLNWAGAAVLEVPVFLIPQISRSAGLFDVMLSLSHPLDVVVIVLAFALRHVPRVLAVVAGLLMLVSWPLMYV